MVGALPLQDVEDIQGHGNGPDPLVRDWSTRQRGRAQMMWARRPRRMSRPVRCRVGGGSARPLLQGSPKQGSVLDLSPDDTYR
jgi:hypothetical protein